MGRALSKKMRKEKNNSQQDPKQKKESTRTHSDMLKKCKV